MSSERVAQLDTGKQPQDVLAPGLAQELQTQQPQSYWVPPSYNVTNPPNLLHQSPAPQDTTHTTNFIRWAKWCPDGSTALAQCEDASLWYLDFPHETIPLAPSMQSTLPHRLPCFRQAAPVLNFAWYPLATCTDPASFCFVTSVRECPVKLLDGADGRLRASYRIVDHRERQIAPHSLAFNPTATKLYCGFEDAIEVFDVAVPGEGTRLHTTPSKKSRDGLKGIVSSLAFSTDISSGLYAAGSFSPSAPSSSNIAIFSEDTGNAPVLFLGFDSDDLSSSTGYGTGARAGVSQLMFNPMRPHLLYASFRRTDAIYCWDIRGDGASPVEVFDRGLPPGIAGESAMTSGEVELSSRQFKAAATNQRLKFDLDISGTWLGVGDQEGHVSIFDLNVAANNTSGPDIVARTAPVLKFKAHEDAVGSVSFHPLAARVLSVSGSRHFEVDPCEDTDESDDEEEGEEGEDPDNNRQTAQKTQVRKRTAKLTPMPRDTTVKLWDFAHLTVE